MRVVACLVVLTSLAFGRVASAQQVPKERVGFQMALRTGYAIPMGDASEDVELSDGVTGQVPLFIEIGGKISSNVFIGGYFGLAFGGGKNCDDADSCVAVGVRLGPELQYHFTPAGSVNPWIGYGIGIESLAIAAETNGQETTTSLSGFEYARLSGGVDFRLSRVFGIGPFVDFSIGEYTRFEFDTPVFDADGDIEDGAAHQWLTLGVRGVFFP